MNVYVVGTVVTNRLGHDPALKEGRATRPASIPRGTFKFARSVAIPSMVMFHWWDRKPVHYLCTGAIMTEATIGRKVKQLRAITVPCPQAVTDYQRWMGGVDVYDQLRLQKYSLQTSTKFVKYYKSLFFGFVDLALSFSTTFFCERCSLDDAKLWLCNKIRRQYNGVNKACFDIWHDDFDAGESIPATLGKRVVLRRPGQRSGKRKRTSRELRLAGDHERSNDKDSDDSDFED
uniref:PiggyBac transposable element-derived protein domain-containing protein n=1 Tax=Phytophthora ramorum TaxID=164328 RepID=H3GG04_PHYRM